MTLSSMLCLPSLYSKVSMEGDHPFRTLRIQWCNHHVMRSSCHFIGLDQIILMLLEHQNMSRRLVSVQKGYGLTKTQRSRRSRMIFKWFVLLTKCQDDY